MMYPMRLQPRYKEYLWGGTRLKTGYGKLDAPDVTAESWELSCHPDGQCSVIGGDFDGKTIQELGELDRMGFWGQNCSKGDFPILVKLIDAKKDLSIQVHPSDNTAISELGEQGKAEMWYIVDCDPQASIYFGFSKQITQEELFRRAEDGTICQVLNRVPVSPGDVFYILPGTIHAIGAGIVIAEIQQNSNTTFRVYDYHRRGTDGKLRPLHLKRAAAVLDYKPIVPEECKANSSVTLKAFTMDEMFSCKYFRAYSIDIRDKITLCCNGKSFHHLLCVGGNGKIRFNGKNYPIQCGQSYFMPAALGEYEVYGTCRVLLSRV